MREVALRTPIRLSRSTAVALVAAQLAGATAMTYVLGGTGPVPPHIFYVPVLFAGIRYGPIGAALTGVAAGLLVGPAMPLDVAASTVQPWSDWVSRLCFFAGIGAVTAFLVEHSINGLRKEAEDLRAEHELLDGIRSGQLRVHYQPIISLDTGTIVGAEALVRWQHPRRGLIGPDEFLPFAKERTMLRYVRQAVLSEACRQTALWCHAIHALPDNFQVSVNVDAVELANPRLLEEVAGALVANSLEPSRLCLEITETGLIEDLDSSIESLLALRLLKVDLAVDDFGTGYASLEYAQSLPVDEFKIDRAFVTNLGRDGRSSAVVESVVALAERMGRETVAEGVEDATELSELIRLGCGRAQGFYFAKPMPQDEFTELLRQAPTWPSRSVFDKAAGLPS